MNRKWIAGGIAGVAIVLGAYQGLRRDDETASTPGAHPPEHRIIAAEGKVEARPGAEMEIGSEMTARIERFLVNEGERVVKGQVIAVLASGDLEARLRQAEAELLAASARRTEIAAGARDQEIRQADAAVSRAQAEQVLAGNEFSRTQELYQNKFVSQSVLDAAESNLKAATARTTETEEKLRLLQAGPRSETLALHAAQVEQAEANVRYIRALLDKTRVLAPISGTLIGLIGLFILWQVATFVVRVREQGAAARTVPAPQP